MKRVYIIRHCQTKLEGISKCISQTDLSLSEVGHEQAYILSTWFKEYPIEKIYVSPMLRCRETASFITDCKNVSICPELTEVSVGEWEGYTFEEIKRKWPMEYAERGRHLGTVAPPGGESFLQAGERLLHLLEHISAEETRDVLVVTHAGILRGALCKLLGTSSDDIFSFPISYGSVTELEWEAGMFKVKRIGYRPWNVPGPAEIKALFEKCQTPLEIQKHGYAVAEKAMEIASGVQVDRQLLYAGGVLHDMCRTVGLEHPEKAAKVLRKEGYEELAQIVYCHHDLSETMTKEGQILYLADRMIMGTRTVTLEERFLLSRSKCRDSEAIAAWEKRYIDAKHLLAQYIEQQKQVLV